MMTAIVSRRLSAVSRFSAKRQLFEPLSLPIYCLCLISGLLFAAAVKLGLFACDEAFVGNMAEASAPVLAFAYATRWIGFRGIADFVEQGMLLFVASITCAFCSLILASTAAPLADPWLWHADMVIFGIDRTRLLANLALSPRMIHAWRLVYNSFAVTPVLATMLLILTGQRWRAWAVLAALIGCAMVSMAFLLVAPAFGTPPYPYAFSEVLSGVRSGSLRTLDGTVITGIVTFPSMHAADAVILAVAFSWLGKWATPLVILNAFMFFSALIVGGHYAVDLVGGAIVGAACISISVWVHRRLGPPQDNGARKVVSCPPSPLVCLANSRQA